MLIRATKSATRALMESFPSQNGNLVQFAPHASGPLGTPIGLLGGAGGRTGGWGGRGPLETPDTTPSWFVAGNSEPCSQHIPVPSV
eukprot:m.298301 g.298301  ORF g.298301 m.298301 type:complete len:86 (-) comp27217_c0_seq4:220-477(-)